MIDINIETLIPLKDVPKRIPSSRSGKRIHVATIYRWVQGGVRGVRLEAVRVGGTTYTSLEALQRFAQQRDEPQPLQASVDRSKLPRWRQRQMEAAAKEVDKILGLDRKQRKNS